MLKIFSEVRARRCVRGPPKRSHSIAERLILLAGEASAGLHNDADDNTEETQSGGENFDDKNLHEKSWIGCICHSCTTSSDSDRDTAEQINDTDSQTREEESESGEEISVCGGFTRICQL
eukprot:TRINITY_DN1979_c0_g1_i3.p1 TRINITY_DN1979_c0_g1~~TRINITY_DN1979_c0_g1_i3.p1  ORF type:complete len:120 (-),score=8.69 TRINITY_DN1979_c0_g1_i3:298-657(-)